MGLIDKMINRYNVSLLPEIMASRFAEFFNEKIVKIQCRLSNKQINAEPSPYSDNPCPVESLQLITSKALTCFSSKFVIK